MPQARKLFRSIQKQTKRKPYVRSAYFRKDKIFFDYFWTHLNKKTFPDRARRLKLLPPAIDLMRTSMQSPKTYVDVQDPKAIRHQFFGMTRERSLFCVIIQHNHSSGKKNLLSIFPLTK